MTMLHAVWGTTHGTRFIVAIKNSIVKHFPIEDVNDADGLAQSLDAEGWDVYYAPSQFHGSTRKATDASVVPALWVDLDAGPGKLHSTAESALDALLAWTQRRALPAPTHVIRSGAGLHVYWLLDAPVSLDRWQPAAQRFKRALAADRVADDLGCTTDAARILRVPGTHNRKNGSPLPVQLLYETDRRVRLDDICAALPALGPQRTRVPDEWAITTDLPPGDIEAIEAGCQQMAHVKAQGGEVPEPLWRASLSVLWRCEGGETLIHEWSKGDPRYDAGQTERKAEATAGPATCEHFSELSDRCEGCPWAGKITSPVQIGLAVPAPTADEPDWRLSRVGKFVVTSGGVWRNQDDAKPKRITQVPLWVVEVRERAKRETNEADDASLQLEWVGVDGRTKRATVAQRLVYSSEQALKGWAASENLASAILDWKGFVTYISQYTLENIKTHGSRQYHETLGWYQGGFVVGDRMIAADGEHNALVQSTNPIAKVVPPEQGTVAGWVEAVAEFDEPRYLPHQFAIQCGFGSALLEPCNLHSAVVSLVGPPGTGKTLSANVALSIYGNPEYLRQGAKSSLKAMEVQLGANRNVPYLVDEITQWSPTQAGTICYMAANGQGDSKLTRSRENFAISHWRLVPFVTSNRPLLDYSQYQFTDAHRARLVELFMGDVMPREQGAIIAHAVEQDHFGTVCVPYLQWLCAHRTEIRGLVDDAVKRITAAFPIADSHRFGVWTLAAAWVGGCIAQSLGLLRWDPWEPVALAGKELATAAAGVIDADEMARDLVSEWLTEHNDHIEVWEMGDTMRSTMIRDPVARVIPSKGTIALHRRKVQDLLAEHGVSRRAAKALFSGGNEKRLNLAPGTAPVWVYEVKYEAVDFEP